MTRKIIRIGTSPNDGTGDSLRETANKINYNFAELYTVFGIDGCGGDVNIHLQPPCGNDLILSTCGTGEVIIGDPTNPVITIPSPTNPADIVIKPPSPSKDVVIGDPTCGGIVKVPGCTTEEPIVIGDPNPDPTKPRITVPTVPDEPIVINPGPDPDGEVIIGNPKQPTSPTGPVPPTITVPNDPTKPIVINPGNPGTGGSGGGGSGGGGTTPTPPPVVIGPPDDPWFKFEPPIGTEPPKLTLGDMDPYRIVWTDAGGALTVGTNLRVQEAKDEIHSIPGYGEVGRNKQFEGSNIILEPHVDTPDPAHPNTPLPGVAGLYFNRPVTDLTKFGEAQNLKALNPTRRAGYIKYWSDNGGNEYSGKMEISPWYQGATSFNTNLIDYDYVARDDRALFITRNSDKYTWGPVVPEGFLGDPGQTTTLRTTQYSFNGGGGHQVVSIGGSLDFASYNAEGGMYKSNVPQYSAGANMGYSYINIPALHTHTGPKWMGQISSNPKKIRDVLVGGSYIEADGIPFWSLGYKMSTQLQENYPSIGIAQYERIPDNHAISWDVRGRVSINEATLDETLNILGSLKIQVASTQNNPNGVVNSNYRTGRKQTGEENQVGIYFADGTFQYTAWLGTGLNKSINILGTTNEVEVTGPTNGVFTVGLPDDVTITRNLTVGGDLIVNGTTTTINSTTLTVDDKNIELGSVATPTETTANGGGITLKGGTDKTIIWQQSSDRWVFNRGIDVVDAVVNNLESNKFVKTDVNKKLITSDILWSDIGSPPCGTPITIGHACNPGNGVKIPAGSDGTSPVEVGNGTNPVKIGGGGDSGGTGITVPKNGSGEPIKIGSPIRFADGTTQSTAAKTYSHSAEETTGGAFIRLKGTATGATDTNDDVKLANGTNVTITRTDADTITIAANNTTYSHSAEATTGGAFIRLTDSSANNDDIKLASGTNVTVTRTDADTITISSIDTNTTYGHSAEETTGGAMLRLTGSDSTNDDVKFAGAGATTITRTDANTITVTSIDTNTTYGHSAETTTGGAMLRLTGSDSTNDDVKFASGTGINVVRTDANTITINNTVVDTNTTYTHSAETTSGGAMIRLTGSDSTNDDVKLIAGSNITVTRTDADTITIGAVIPPCDTLYDKGTGGGNLVFDRNQGTIQKITLTSNVTSVTITGLGAAQSFTIIFKQDGTGGRTVTTAPEFKFASGYKTFSTAANAIDMLNIFSDGTTFYCTLTTGYA